MSQKKRKNTEIIEFLGKFVKWISQKLSQIQIVKLSSDHIKETEDLIKEIKSRIKETKKAITKQQAVVNKITASLKKTKSASLIPKSVVAKSLSIDPEIEVFDLEEDEDE